MIFWGIKPEMQTKSETSAIATLATLGKQSERIRDSPARSCHRKTWTLIRQIQQNRSPAVSKMYPAEKGGEAAIAGPGPARGHEICGIGGRDPRRRVVHRELKIRDRRLLDAQGER